MLLVQWRTSSPPKRKRADIRPEPIDSWHQPCCICCTGVHRVTDNVIKRPLEWLSRWLFFSYHGIFPFVDVVGLPWRSETIVKFPQDSCATISIQFRQRYLNSRSPLSLSCMVAVQAPGPSLHVSSPKIWWSVWQISLQLATVWWGIICQVRSR
jgi:hypothetical protein